MNDFMSHKVNVSCPNCKKDITISLGDIKNEKEIECTNCNKTIKLQDKDSGVEKLNRAMKDFKKSLAKKIISK